MVVVGETRVKSLSSDWNIDVLLWELSRPSNLQTLHHHGHWPEEIGKFFHIFIMIINLDWKKSKARHDCLDILSSSRFRSNLGPFPDTFCDKVKITANFSIVKNCWSYLGDKEIYCKRKHIESSSKFCFTIKFNGVLVNFSNHLLVLWTITAKQSAFKRKQRLP